MELSGADNILHLRLNSCLETVLRFQRVISRSALAPELDGRFSDLMELVSALDSSAMDEREVAEVELATNNLLSNMKAFPDLIEAKGAAGQVLN